VQAGKSVQRVGVRYAKNGGRRAPAAHAIPGTSLPARVHACEEEGAHEGMRRVLCSKLSVRRGAERRCHQVPCLSEVRGRSAPRGGEATRVGRGVVVVVWCVRAVGEVRRVHGSVQQSGAGVLRVSVSRVLPWGGVVAAQPAQVRAARPTAKQGVR